MTLSVVPDLPAEQPAALLPLFEGERVAGLRARLVSTGGLELGEAPHRIDETARLLVTGRVTRVDHVVDEKSGRLIRVETLKIVEAVEVEWEAVSALLMDE